nr:MAG TPA: hypothetical protein [Caudoviricetes sp.]
MKKSKNNLTVWNPVRFFIVQTLKTLKAKDNQSTLDLKRRA